MTMGERFASAHDAYADGSDTTSLPLLIHNDFLWTSFTRPTGSPAVTKQEMLQMIEDAGPDDEVTVFHATDEILVMGFRGDYGSLLLTVQFENFLAVKAWGATVNKS